MIKDYEFKNNCDLKTLIESYGLEYPKSHIRYREQFLLFHGSVLGRSGTFIRKAIYKLRDLTKIQCYLKQLIFYGS